ncbi:GNAT family N-acetyltransferase [Cryobacterium sp. TMT2-15-1]|uniref:GNAT family N-acetyltransferase n=1 Tax=Cryobacterium sp. TMT2-15-1 TaxID=1259246 RepID=UPI00106BF110|nr:GNAT family N-acetyltransferase [Cryobacterium sp. TMT2-15-1]
MHSASTNREANDHRNGWETRGMENPCGENDFLFRSGTAEDAAGCVSLWVAACVARDGEAVDGVAERARLKFDNSECWIVAEDAAAGLVGFVLATKPGSGLASDPPDSPVMGLLAVTPGAQGRGLGGTRLTGATAALARHGHERSVLHVLADHRAAVHLYEKNGWRPRGELFPHSLLGRPSQTYVLDLDLPGVR